VVPLAATFLHERMPRLKLLGFAVGIAGVAVLFNPFGFDWGDPKVLIGNGLLMLAALLWAVQIVQVRGHRWDGSPLTLAPWQFLVATCLITPLALYVDHGQPIRWGAACGLILFYNGPIAAAFGFWATISFTRALPAVTTSLGTLGVPAMGLVLSALFLGERLTVTIVGGLVLILAGLTLVTLADRARTAAG
jgi:drug/metabolite transporter (DMT)-like permease